VVLVGGKGTRLRPLTSTTPKQMLPVGGRPMIEHVVAHLAAHGVDEVVLSLGFQPDAFVAAYPERRCGGVPIRYAVEPKPLDTAGAVAFAARAAGIDETFVVANGDVLTDLDLGALVAFHRSRPASATIHLTPVEDPSRYGVVPTEPDGRVVAFIEKPPAGTAPTNLINGGTYVLEPEVLERVPPDEPCSIERVTFPALVAERLLYALASPAAWIDAGTPATYLAANLRAAGADLADVAASPGVDPSATVSHSVIGAGVTIGARAVVRGSLLLPGAGVGAGASVTESIVGPGAQVGEGAVVERLSVLGSGVRVPAGALVSGERVPEHAP